MNQKGFGTKDIIAFIFVVVISLCIVAFLYNDLSENNGMSVFKNSSNDEVKKESFKTDEIKVSTYDELEKNISEKSKLYFASNDVEVVSLMTLNQNQYIPTIYSLDENKNDCIGYVIDDKNMDIIKTYLSCGTSYKTAGYDVSKEPSY